MTFEPCSVTGENGHGVWQLPPSAVTHHRVARVRAGRCGTARPRVPLGHWRSSILSDSAARSFADMRPQDREPASGPGRGGGGTWG